MSGPVSATPFPGTIMLWPTPHPQLKFDGRRSTHIGSAVDLTAMSEAQHKYDELLVSHVIDDSVVADPNAEFPVATTELQTPLRSGVLSKRVNSPQDSLSNGTV